MTERNRKRILQELIESLLKEEKEIEHAYSLKFHNFEGYEKVIPLTKKNISRTSTVKIQILSTVKIQILSTVKIQILSTVKFQILSTVKIQIL